MLVKNEYLEDNEQLIKVRVGINRNGPVLYITDNHGGVIAYLTEEDINMMQTMVMDWRIELDRQEEHESH